MATLYLYDLIAKHACDRYVDLFHERFGTEVEITEDLCEQNCDFAYEWAGEHLLRDNSDFLVFEQQCWDTWCKHPGWSEDDCDTIYRRPVARAWARQYILENP